MHHQYNRTEGWPNTGDFKFSATGLAADGAATFSAKDLTAGAAGMATFSAIDLRAAGGAATFSAKDLVAADDGATTRVTNNNRGGAGNE